MSSYLENNRKRLIDLLSNIPQSSSPEGWEKAGAIAISGFIGFGFSKQNSNLALIVTSTGRSLVDCSTSEKIARDRNEYQGLDESGIYCQGIDQLKEENILLAGQSGGGLPLTTKKGESLTLVSPNWPQYDLIFCGASGHPLFKKFQSNCVIVTTDFIEAAGFSWCGNYFAIATSSDFDIWKRVK